VFAVSDLCWIKTSGSQILSTACGAGLQRAGFPHSPHRTQVARLRSRWIRLRRWSTT
jgi:hypothetical protein